MILVDMSQVMISNLMVGVNTYAKDLEVDEGLLRHMVLNSLRSYRVKFKEQYGELVLCYDAPNSWRKEVFPDYKVNRKKNRTVSDLDWSNIFRVFGELENDFREHFPYMVLRADRAEADDIIATIIRDQTSRIMTPETPRSLLIISGDKDFIQLHKYPNVAQYSPVQKVMITHDDPEAYLAEHILRGDASDGIPNFLSDDKCFVESRRQKPIMAKKMTKWLEKTDRGDFTWFAGDMRRNFIRNKQLIDISDSDQIPNEIVADILDTYYEEAGNPTGRKDLLPYFFKHRLRNLMDVIHEF